MTCRLLTDICCTLSSFLSLTYQLPSRLYGDSLQVNVTIIWIFSDFSEEEPASYTSCLLQHFRCWTKPKKKMIVISLSLSKNQKNKFCVKSYKRKRYIWSIALSGAESLTLRAVDQKHLEGSEMWCWRRMEKISWSDRVRNGEVLLRVKEQGNILHEMSKRNAKGIGHFSLRNCLLRRVIEGKIKGGMYVKGRRGRRRRNLLDDLKERKGYSHLEEEALDRTVWRAGFGRGFGHVVRQDCYMNAV